MFFPLRFDLFRGDFWSRVKYGVEHSVGYDSSQCNRNDDYNKRYFGQSLGNASDSRQYTRNSLVHLRGLDTFTQFFNRPKLQVIPDISLTNFRFHVSNTGKNTASKLRAELFVYSELGVPDYFELSWRVRDASQPVDEVTLSYLRSADVFCPNLTFLTSVDAIDLVYIALSIVHIPLVNLNRREICDVSLHIFGEYGIEKWQYLSLVTTGDASAPISFVYRARRLRDWLRL